MDQEKIGKLIKEIRKKDNLTQEKFAQKYNVTYQAVSKWENGKSIPDITILKQICEDYHCNINDLLSGNNNSFFKKKRNILLISAVGLIMFLGIISLIFIKDNNKNDFEFKTLSTACNNFNLYGSIAYSSNKTSIYISNISYCGKEKDNQKYDKIECTLYENDGKEQIKVSSYKSNKKNITLDQFLESVSFNVDHYSKTCKMYKKNALYLQIEATTKSKEIKIYKIPLKLEDNCDAK